MRFPGRERIAKGPDSRSPAQLTGDLDGAQVA
jgi:hypothetical protein